LLDLPLAAARATATAAVKVFVGIQTQEEQAVDFAAFQRLVGLQSLVHLRQTLAQVLQVKPLADIMQGVVADASTPMDQMLPAPALGLLGNIQIAAHAQKDSQQQAQEQGLGGNLRARPMAAHPARDPAQSVNLGGVGQKLSQFVHAEVSPSG